MEYYQEGKETEEVSLININYIQIIKTAGMYNCI